MLHNTHTAETIQSELDARLYSQEVTGLRFRRALELKDGSRLSCQDHSIAVAHPGRSFEVALFDPCSRYDFAEIEELGQSVDGVYGWVTPEQIADIVNLRGGLKV